MADRLFVSSVEVKDGRVLVGLGLGVPVGLSGTSKVRDLDGGLSEHEAALVDGEDRFVLRVIVDSGGSIVAAVAAPVAVDDGWHEALNLS